MILVLYGPDTYRSRQKLREIVEEYRQKAGSEFNLEKLDAEENDLSGLKNMVQGGSLFSSKKLIILENAFSGENNFDRILAAAQKVSVLKNIFLIFLDGALTAQDSKRLEEIKPLADKVQEFKILIGGGLQIWLDQETKKRGLKLDVAQRIFFASLGGDLWRITNELDKLSLFALSAGPTAGQEYNIFGLGDAFFISPRAALRVLLSLVRQGQDDFGLFSYVAGHARTLLTVKTCLDKRIPVSAHGRLHPYVVKKASALARELNYEKLRSLPEKFFEEDFKIKIGLSRPDESLLRILFSSQRM